MKRRASTTDLLTWSDFDTAFDAYKEGVHDGVGFCFCSADPFVFIDLDDCVDPETKTVEDWAKDLARSFEDATYVELSPSETGLHIIIEARFRGGKRRGQIEVYGQDRFSTITGQRVEVLQ